MNDVLKQLFKSVGLRSAGTLLAYRFLSSWRGGLGWGTRHGGGWGGGGGGGGGSALRIRCQTSVTAFGAVRPGLSSTIRVPDSGRLPAWLARFGQFWRGGVTCPRPKSRRLAWVRMIGVKDRIWFVLEGLFRQILHLVGGPCGCRAGGNGATEPGQLPRHQDHAVDARRESRATGAADRAVDLRVERQIKKKKKQLGDAGQRQYFGAASRRLCQLLNQVPTSAQLCCSPRMAVAAAAFRARRSRSQQGGPFRDMRFFRYHRPRCPLCPAFLRATPLCRSRFRIRALTRQLPSTVADIDLPAVGFLAMRRSADRFCLCDRSHGQGAGELARDPNVEGSFGGPGPRKKVRPHPLKARMARTPLASGTGHRTGPHFWFLKPRVERPIIKRTSCLVLSVCFEATPPAPVPSFVLPHPSNPPSLPIPVFSLVLVFLPRSPLICFCCPSYVFPCVTSPSPRLLSLVLVPLNCLGSPNHRRLRAPAPANGVPPSARPSPKFFSHLNIDPVHTRTELKRDSPEPFLSNSPLAGALGPRDLTFRALLKPRFRERNETPRSSRSPINNSKFPWKRSSAPSGSRPPPLSGSLNAVLAGPTVAGTPGRLGRNQPKFPRNAGVAWILRLMTRPKNIVSKPLPGHLGGSR